MEKYTVNVHLLNLNENGLSISESNDFDFPIDLSNPLSSRKSAIEKTKELIDTVDTKDSTSYSISISFVTKDSTTQLTGHFGMEKFDWLEAEYNIYKENGYEVDTFKAIFADNDYTIIKNDYEFLTAN